MARLGPLLMNGAKWFGKGPGSSLSVMTRTASTRDSSGWDTRYLIWSRLYGEVGFSGWVVACHPGRSHVLDERVTPHSSELTRRHQ